MLSFILLNIFGPAYTQVISGTVLDKKTNIPVYSATVYFDGTSIGTITDKNGNFALDISNNARMPLHISSLGYVTASLDYPGYTTAESKIIYLTPKVFELNEVEIKAKSLTGKRKSNLIIFRNEFLGTSGNARSCIILNENDIIFSYGNDPDILVAYSSKPIRIVNKNLGYMITYFLDKFEYYKKSKSFVYKGNLIFSEDLAMPGQQKKTYERKRRNSYYGSRMHFFRALWSNELKSSGFNINNQNDDYPDYEVLVNEDEQGKFLKYNEGLSVYYYSKIPTSQMNFLKDKIYFQKNGYFDESGISWEGKMANKRIGDQVPYNYM